MSQNYFYPPATFKGNKLTTKISWFGHCCFLLELGNYKILIDPYTQFLNINVGQIPADYLILSSIAPDHGNIAASLQAYSNIYPGVYRPTPEITLTAIETKEEVGTPTIIWNICYQNFAITNFADFYDLDWQNKIATADKNVLSRTNIALLRTNPPQKNLLNHHELALRLCHPEIIIPIHYYPQSFIKTQLPQNRRGSYLKKIRQVNQMAQETGYKIEKINSYQTELAFPLQFSRKTIFFQAIHPQVHYVFPQAI